MWESRCRVLLGDECTKFASQGSYPLIAGRLPWAPLAVPFFSSACVEKRGPARASSGPLHRGRRPSKESGWQSNAKSPNFTTVLAY